MNTQALFCLSLPLVIAGCAQQTSTSTARDSAFAQSLRPPVFSDIYQRSPEVTRSGRYTLVSVKSADAQREPLNQLIDITMPGQLVNSVGDGFRYLLFQSGYSLCGRYGADFAELLKRPLPAVQRKIGPMRLSEALQVVAGPAWRMSVDEVNREVCFVLRDAYLAQAKTTASATPTLKSSDTAGVYVSPETSRNPYTGVLPGKNAVPVVAGQLLTSKKDTAQKPVSEFLPVTGLVIRCERRVAFTGRYSERGCGLPQLGKSLMTRKRYNVRLRLAATVVAAVLSLSGCTFQEMDRMSRKAQASGDIAREHVSEQMRSSQGALVWTDKPWVNLKPVPTVSRDTPLENFPDCQITLARDGLTLPEIGERITALCGVRVIFSPDALAVGQSSGTTRALNGPLPTPDNNGRIPLDQLGGAVDRAGVTATPLVLSGLRWQGKLSGLLDMIAARTGLTPRMDNGAIHPGLLCGECAL